MGQLGKAGGKARHRANAGGDNFAIVAKGLRGRENAEFCESDVGHQKIGSGRAATASFPPKLLR